MYENHKEEHLWKEFLEGNQDSFDQFYQLFFPKLFHYGICLCQDKDLVKDCIQSLFIHFWSKRKKLTKIKSIRRYLFKSLRNRIYRQLNISPYTIFLDQELIANYRKSVTNPVETHVINQQNQLDQKIMLDKAFAELSARQKEAIYLRFYEDMAYEDIANLMSFRDPKYARTIIYRALEKLRKILGKQTIA